MAQMRQELQDLQIGMQRRRAVLIQQQAQVTDATTRAQAAEQERADMAIIAAKIAARADDGDIIDNEALGQPFKYTDKKDSDLGEGDHKVGIFMGARERKSLEP